MAHVVFAQEIDDTPDEEFIPTYTLGDQMLSIDLGIVIPLFFALGDDGIAPTQLSVGGAGALYWGAFLTNELAVGLDVAGSFMFTPNRRTLFLLPIAARASYFFRRYPFEFPVHLGLGLSISRLEEATKVDFIAKPGASVYWNYNAEWAFGLNAEYWFVPQIYIGDSPPSDDSRIGNFLSVTLSALYRF